MEDFGEYYGIYIKLNHNSFKADTFLY